MGYYSNVVIVIAKEAHDDFLNILAPKAFELKCTDGYGPAELLQDADKEEYPEAVVYSWPSIKWYTHSDPSVMAIMAALKELDSDCYKFYRLGEEYGDYEIYGNYSGEPQFGVVHSLEQFC